MQWFFIGIEKYFDFRGRATRKEYWMFVLMSTLLAFAIGFTLGILQAITHIKFAVLTHVYTLGILIPSTAVAARRLHDINRSGWWMLVPIVGFVFMFYKGTPGENRFGPESNPTV